MFGGVFRAACLQQGQHAGLQRFDVHAFAHDVILMQNVAHEMPVIKPVQQLVVDLVRQLFAPIAVVAFQRDVEREDVLHLCGVDVLIADRGPCGGKAVQPRDLALARGAGEKVSLPVGKGGGQMGLRLFDAAIASCSVARPPPP